MSIEPRRQPPGLRARKRLAAMEHVQRVALELFESEGYDEVTIARIAAVAGVGERSIYRYFRSKPMLVLHDELDQRTIDLFAVHLADRSVIEAIRASLEQVAPLLAGGATSDSARRLRLIHDHPQLRAALADYANQLGDALGRIIAAERSDDVDEQVARIHGRCVIVALSTAIDDWFLAGASEPLADALVAAVDALAELA